jgi:hypothetical protein
MPSCVLRVAGSTIKIKRLLRESSLEPSKVYFRGDPGFPKSRGPVKTSGFNIVISGSHGESIEKQAREALSFLRKHRADLLLMKSMKFKFTLVDFRLNDLATEDRPWPSYRLPATFVEAAGELGLEVILSFYGAP